MNQIVRDAGPASPAGAAGNHRKTLLSDVILQAFGACCRLRSPSTLLP
jgi:hypothetical protein